MEVRGGLGEAVEGVDLVALMSGLDKEEGKVPFAPASNNASACVRPNPRAAPVTRTTLPARLNSGRPVVLDMLPRDWN